MPNFQRGTRGLVVGLLVWTAAALPSCGEETWHQLAANLDDCATECSRCLALMIPRCADGFCGGAP